MSDDGRPAITVRGLRKQFRGREVLHGLDLQVLRGQLVGLVGKNGAGKSTLLRVLTGLSPRDSGDVAVLGHDPARESLQIRRRLAYLPGETSVYHNMTGQQFVDFALSFYPRLQQGLLDELRELFALPFERKVRGYSAGMKQKLAVLVTLVPDVELYLLDEPDRALDASMRFQLREVLGRLRDSGKTLLLSSHHLSEVEHLADRLEFLLDGLMVPHETVRAARAQLQRRVRVRLQPGTPLPEGTTVLATEPDDVQVLETPGAPMQSLQALPPEAVRGVELGVARLEELYKLLLEQRAESRQ